MFRLLFGASIGTWLLGCVDAAETKSASSSAARTSSEANFQATPLRVLSIQVICNASFPDQRRYSHMLRMTSALDHIDFTGGFGQRVFATQTSQVMHEGNGLVASFYAEQSAQHNWTSFELSIDRRTLGYALSYTEGTSVITPASDASIKVTGRCSVIEGSEFKL